MTVRQRPGTSNGVVFMTHEDETGVINVIIRPTVLERFRKEILSASLVTPSILDTLPSLAPIF
ncbi:hypothetical protein KAF44_10340 [Cupriavidus necator]|nr:hypothetical protein KAF44_10340 [Cupriavidus necator]